MGAVRSKKVLLLRILVALGLAGILLVAGLSWRVATAAAGQVFSVFEVPATDVAIVFGARVWQGGRLTPEVEDRVLTAVDLYRSGKVKKLLMSGDNSRVQYDEPTAMGNYAIGRGVPAQDIVLDFAGFHTYDTCYRAQSVFGLRRVVLVTQRFHLARALFTASHLGLEAVGVAADRRRYQRALWYLLREQVARARAFVQVLLVRPRPRFLGPPVQVLLRGSDAARH